MNKWRGFTLIEMLVVIAIIGILASMLSGPLMAARGSALSASCANLLKGYGTSTTMYTNQWDLYMPDVQTYLQPTSGFLSNFGVDAPDESITRCPDDGTTESLGRLYDYSDSAAGIANLKISIAGCGNLLSNSKSPTSGGYKQLYWKYRKTYVNISRPSRAIIWSDYQCYTGCTDPAAVITSYKTIVFRHHESFNAVFLDNHVGNVSPTFDLQNDGHDWDTALSSGTLHTQYPFGPRQGGGPSSPTFNVDPRTEIPWLSY